MVKDSKSKEEYLTEITTLVDVLGVVREVLMDKDLVLIVLNGLGDEFKSFIQNIGLSPATSTSSYTVDGHKSSRQQERLEKYTPPDMFREGARGPKFRESSAKALVRSSR